MKISFGPDVIIADDECLILADLKMDGRELTEKAGINSFTDIESVDAIISNYVYEYMINLGIPADSFVIYDIGKSFTSSLLHETDVIIEILITDPEAAAYLKLSLEHYDPLEHLH